MTSSSFITDFPYDPFLYIVMIPLMFKVRFNKYFVFYMLIQKISLACLAREKKIKFLLVFWLRLDNYLCESDY